MKSIYQGTIFFAVIIAGMIVAGWIAEYLTANPIVSTILFIILGIYGSAVINTLIKRKK